MKGAFMKGIQYLTNEQGDRTAVVIDLKKYRDLWEDFQDAIIAKMREKEPRESLIEVKERLNIKDFS
jgi:hypothetical protein